MREALDALMWSRRSAAVLTRMRSLVQLYDHILYISCNPTAPWQTFMCSVLRLYGRAACNL